MAGHFNNVLNRPASINDEAIARLPQVEMNKDPDNLPTEGEVRKAIKQLSCGNAPGSDAIPTKVYKAGSRPNHATETDSTVPVYVE